MSGTFAVAMGDRGRLVIPAELRDRMNLAAGSAVLLVETSRGVVLMTRAQAKDLVRSQLEGLHLVEELMKDRRQAAADDDVA